MNREQRRHPRGSAPPRPKEQPARPVGRPPDEPDPRAKSTGHGKKTADKWNQ